MRCRRLSLLAALAVVVSSCGSGKDDSPAGFCRRFNDLRGELILGEVNESELQKRVTAESLGDPGGSLSDLRAELEAAVEAKDGEAIASVGDTLTQRCAG